jgi:hypothetical protein
MPRRPAWSPRDQVEAPATAVKPPILNVISLGAGVQSTTMALMAARGEIAPMPDCAIFADTQAEPAAVYRHLEWLMSPGVLPFPVYVVTAGNLSEHVAAIRPKGRYINFEIPAFVKSPDGSVALINRSCTRDFKIDPIRRKVRELLGIAGRRSPRGVVIHQWIGISIDEAQRMKPSREVWQEMRWPLIEKRMSRHDCLAWLRRNGYPLPTKSACTFCPYHSNSEWRALTEEEFAGACEVDNRLRSRPPEAYRTKGILYLHRSCVPLSEVDLSTPAERGSPPLFDVDGFGNECEGMCGL